MTTFYDSKTGQNVEVNLSEYKKDGKEYIRETQPRPNIRFIERVSVDNKGNISNYTLSRQLAQRGRNNAIKGWRTYETRDIKVSEGQARQERYRTPDKSFNYDYATQTRENVSDRARRQENKKVFIYTKGQPDRGRFVSKTELNELTTPKPRNRPLNTQINNKYEFEFTSSGIKGDLNKLTKEERRDLGRQYVAWRKGDTKKQPLGVEGIKKQTALFSETQQSTQDNDKVSRIMNTYRSAPQTFSVSRYGDIKLKNGNIIPIGSSASAYDKATSWIGNLINMGRDARYGARGVSVLTESPKDKTLISGKTRADIFSYITPVVGQARFITEGASLGVTLTKAGKQQLTGERGGALDMVKQNKGETIFATAIYSAPVVYNIVKSGVPLIKTKINNFKLSQKYKGQIVTKQNYGIVETTKALSTEVKVRPLESFTAKQTAVSGSGGSTSKSVLNIKLGKPQYIKPTDALKEGSVRFSGVKEQIAVRGSRANIISTKANTRAIITPNEVTTPTGSYFYANTPYRSQTSLSEFSKAFENMRVVKSDSFGVSKSLFKYKGSSLVVKQTAISTTGTNVPTSSISKVSGKIDVLPFKQTTTTSKDIIVRGGGSFKDFSQPPPYGGMVGTQNTGKKITSFFSNTFKLKEGTGKALYVYDTFNNPANTNPFITTWTPTTTTQSSVFGTFKTIGGNIEIKPRKFFSSISTITPDKPLKSGEVLQADGTILRLKPQETKQTAISTTQQKQQSETKTKIFSVSKPTQKTQSFIQTKRAVVGLEKPTTKQKNPTKTIQTSGQRFKPLFGYSSKQASLGTQSIKTPTITAQQQKQIFDSIQKVEVIQQTKPATKTINETIFKPATKTNFFSQRKSLSIPQQREQALFPPPPYKPTLDKNKKESGGFNVFVKRRGSFFKANRNPLSQADAINKGAFIVGNTSSATFKIEKTDTGRRGFFSGRGKIEDFYKKGDLFIEKRKRRIKSIGELQEITFKGLSTKKARKKGGFFTL